MNLLDSDEKPRTFACHHYAETCRACEWMVQRWKEARAMHAAALVDDVAGQVKKNEPDWSMV